MVLDASSIVKVSVVNGYRSKYMKSSSDSTGVMILMFHPYCL